MSVLRIRVSAETLESGFVEWARSDGERVETGTGELGTPPVSGECEIVLASELVLLDDLPVPAAQQRRIGGALAYLAEESVIPDPETVHVSAVRAEQPDRLAVAIIERQWLARLRARLERASIRARAAWPECLLAPLPKDAWTVICSERASFARTGKAAGVTLDRVDGSQPPVVLHLALAAARASGRAPARIGVHLVGELDAPDLAQWSAALGLPVELLPSWHWSQSRETPTLDVLQGEFAARAISGDAQRRMRRTAVLAGALLVVASGALVVDWAAKAAERRGLLSEMRAIYRETFGEAAVIADPPLQMERSLAELRRKAGEPARTDLMALLAPLALRLGNAARIDSLTYERGTLSLSLTARDPAALAAVLDDLRATRAAVDVRTQPTDASGRMQITLATRTSR